MEDPLLVRSHRRHSEVVRWWDGQELALSGHALAETYSVLTRLPGDARLTPGRVRVGVPEFVVAAVAAVAAVAEEAEEAGDRWLPVA